eukprot:Nitzschia sp. Nitz4//scaffold128_size63911//6687//7961//NITZ4_006212-RA/size63911-processed-gene-0.126-mRNA-1//-1//CDS//3329534811//1893//frame0
MATEDLEEDFVTLGDLGDNDDENEPSSESTLAQYLTKQPENDLPPWMAYPVDLKRISPLVALHNEVVGFCKLMEPRNEEIKKREELVARFKVLIASTFTDAEVEVFGSQATGLFLPSSDIDIAIHLSEQDSAGLENKEEDEEAPTKASLKEDMENWDSPSGSPLRRLEQALREQWIDDLSYLELIENTRVPLVKFTHKPTDISVDVCFNQTTGGHAAELMKRYLEALPPLRPLTFVLKYFMASRGLNQPYTGGVGSFMLQLMIISFLQHREREARYNRRPNPSCLGSMLIEFFEFYSLDFNYITTGVSVRFDGFYFPKGAKDRKGVFYQPTRPFSFALENPLDVALDVGSPSFRISIIQRSFEVAFKAILTHVTEPFEPTLSILASVLPVSEEMMGRAGSAVARAPPKDPRSPSAGPPKKKRRR